LFRKLVAGALSLALGAPALAQAPSKTYFAYVLSEAIDEVSIVKFGPQGASVEKKFGIGMSITDPDGPHGVSLAPDGKHIYITTAHGLPGGSLWKYEVGAESPVASTILGSFPATVQVSSNGWYAFVVNFNLYGEMVQSSVSVVATKEMIEVARIPTCTMPHGSRLTADGKRHYSACMMDETLVEIDAERLKVARHFFLTAGKEMAMEGTPAKRGASAGSSESHGGHGMEPPKPGDISCSPTWAQPSADGSRVWVACNKSSEIVEIDVAKWALVRRLKARDGVYNLGVTRDGTKLIATNKRDQSVSVFDTKSGTELARIPTTKRVVHGVAVTPDDRYAFVTSEGVGSEPASVDIIDLVSLTRVASVAVGPQAGGVEVWKVVP
jgi:DNA-binding beta-propeller fold protein YncE